MSEAIPKRGAFFPERQVICDSMQAIQDAWPTSPMEERADLAKAAFALQRLLLDIDKRTWWPQRPAS